MALDNGISSYVQQYVSRQSGGAVVLPVNGSWIQAYCEHLGVNNSDNNSWLQALCVHLGQRDPINGSWTLALCAYHGITTPVNGTWWGALGNIPGTGPQPTRFWQTQATNWEATADLWEQVPS